MKKKDRKIKNLEKNLKKKEKEKGEKIKICLYDKIKKHK